MPLAHLPSLPIRINWEANTPPFAQVFSQINCMIMTGQLKQGVLLPQIRNLAAQLDANPNTIARAYDELARAGLIRKRQGSGCFVTGVVGGASPTRRLEALRGRIEELAMDAQALGIPLSDLIAELRRHIPGQPTSGTSSKRNSQLPRPGASHVPDFTPPLTDAARPVTDLWPAAGGLID